MLCAPYKNLLFFMLSDLNLSAESRSFLHGELFPAKFGAKGNIN